MFYNTKEFKTMEAGLKLTSIQQQLHLQNLANIETPGYKSKSLDFENSLKNAQQKGTKNTLVNAKVITNDALSVLNDGNNVDIEKENLGAYKTYVQYTSILNKIRGQFDNYNQVLNINFK